MGLESMHLGPSKNLEKSMNHDGLQDFTKLGGLTVGKVVIQVVYRLEEKNIEVLDRVEDLVEEWVLMEVV